MKKLLVAILMVLVLGGSSAFAGGSSRASSGQGYSSGAIVSPSGQVIDTRGGLIYNMTINSSTGTGLLLIFDSPVVPFTSSTQETPIYEVEVASAGDSRSVDMSACPLQTYTGIVASVTNGVGYLNVQN